jgi:hypothetical protein
LHCRGVAGVNGRSCDVGYFTRVAFDSGGHRSHSDKPDRRWRADLFVYRHEPRPAFLRNPTASGGKISREATRVMTRAPHQNAIYAAELRVAQSRWNTQESLRGVRVAFRATLARPSTLALIAGTAGPVGFWLARQPQPQSTSAFDGAAAAKTTSVAGVMLAFIMRYGMQRLPMILQQVWTAWQKRASRIDPDMPKYPTTDFSATATRH